MRRSATRILAVIASIAATVSPACGGDSGSQLSCGPGTMESHGVCVPRPQGTGGMAGAVGQDASTDAGSDAQPPMPDAASDAEASSQIPDDPCPPTPIFMDCSGQCQDLTTACTDPQKHATCSESPTYVSVEKHEQFPFVIRTPSKPGMDPACTALCGPGSTAYGLAVRVVLPYDPVYLMRVKVGAPWRILFAQTGEYCMGGSVAECHIFTPNFAGTATNVTIVTDDPNAPARNVVVERLPKPVTCP